MTKKITEKVFPCAGSLPKYPLKLEIIPDESSSQERNLDIQHGWLELK